MSARACQRNPTINGDKRPKYCLIIKDFDGEKPVYGAKRITRDELIAGVTHDGYNITQVLPAGPAIADVPSEQLRDLFGREAWRIEQAQELMGGGSGVPSWQRGDTMRVNVDGEIIRLKFIGSDEDIKRMKALDDLCFGEHQGISEEALRVFRQNGLLYMVEDADGNPIAEGQSVLRATRGAEESIVRNLPTDVGYAEGAAVAPEHRRGTARGKYGRAMSKGRQQALKAAGKVGEFGTTRLENAGSIRGAMDVGMMLIAYDPAYYEGEGGGRGVLYANLKHSEVSKQATTWVPVTPGDELDVPANEEVRRLLNEEGLVATTMRRGEDGRAELGFLHPRDLPDELRRDVQKRQLWTRRNAGVEQTSSLPQILGAARSQDQTPQVAPEDRARALDDLLTIRFDEALASGEGDWSTSPDWGPTGDGMGWADNCIFDFEQKMLREIDEAHMDTSASWEELQPQLLEAREHVRAVTRDMRARLDLLQSDDPKVRAGEGLSRLHPENFRR